MDKRIRSPNYPALSLKQAIDRVMILYRNQHRHPAPREVVAKSLGFGALSGPASTVISSLYKYGLLDREGTESKISERALQILHPHSEAERTQALRAAAQEPQLFAELNERFPGEPPSDELLKNYLLRKNFSPSAVAGVIAAYKETSEFVEHETQAYDSSADFTEAEEAMAAGSNTQPTDPGRFPPVPPKPPGQAPMIAIMGDGKLVVNATLSDRESVEALIDMLTTVKDIAPPRKQAESGSGSEPVMDGLQRLSTRVEVVGESDRGS